jgi:hypothetical protein
MLLRAIQSPINVHCGQKAVLCNVNLYPTNAPNPFKSASCERTISVCCSHLNALYTHVEA